MSSLHDFLYLDAAKLYSFVSQIQGGLISEINETIKQLGGLSAGIAVGIPTAISGKLDASKGKESERQQTLLLTDPAYFRVLHEYLQREKELTDITDISAEKITELDIGQFVELKGIAEPPLVENWIYRVYTIFNFIEKYFKTAEKLQPKGQNRSTSNLSNMQIRQYKSIIDMLSDYIQLARKDPGKQYIRIATKPYTHNVWCGLLPEYTAVALQSTLPAEVQLFGRVERLLKPTEIYKIVDLSLFDQSSQIDNLLQALNSFGILIGQPEINETDLQATSPDIFITPVAIYR